MKFRDMLLALPILGAATTASAANLTGNYLVTIHAVGAQDQQVCYTLNQTGAVLNFPVSGTWSVAGNPEAGYFFVTRHQLQLFGVAYGLFYDLTGTIDSQLHTVVGTSFVVANAGNATPAVGGTFTAARNGC